ncbi:MAG: class D sortase [Terriglobia bacterium]|nr:class D sortase [Terriglobia bacterium]
MTVKVVSILERIFLSLGLILMGFAIVAMVQSALLSRAAIAKFDRATEAKNKASFEELGRIDFSLWEPQRVKAYLSTLSVPIDTPLAVLRVPRLAIEVPVLQGTDEFSLNRGVGWVAGTARPGSTGNSGIAGHRDGFFRALKDIRIGDTVEIAAVTATNRYRVDEIEIVPPSDTAVLRPRPKSSVTLITCYPFYFVGNAPLRFVVHASLADESEHVKGSPNSHNKNY